MLFLICLHVLIATIQKYSRFFNVDLVSSEFADLILEIFVDSLDLCICNHFSSFLVQLADKNSVIKKKREFIRVKLRIIIQEVDSQKALTTVPTVKEFKVQSQTFLRQRIVRQNDILKNCFNILFLTALDFHCCTKAFLQFQASHCGGFSCCRAQAVGHAGSSSCGLPCGVWDLPGPGIEPMSFALAGGFLTSGPPEKPRPTDILHEVHQGYMVQVSTFEVNSRSPGPRIEFRKDTILLRS